MTAEEKLMVLDSIVTEAYESIPAPDVGNPYYGIFVAMMGVLSLDVDK